MSSISIIAINGNQIDKTSEIFDAFKYIDLHHDKQFYSLDSCVTYLNENYFDSSKKNIALRGLWTLNGWTIIWDPEMVDMTDETAMETFSQKLNVEVLTFLIQTTSGSFGFAKYNRTKQRKFYSTDGRIAENFGSPLTEEKGLNINQNIFINDVLQLANKFGIDIEAKNTKTTFLVKELGYN